MLELTDSRILVLAPHTDDGELGAGASLSKWIRMGNDVHYVAFSACETIQPPDRPRDGLRQECHAANAALGLNSNNIRILDFEVRHFDRARQRVLDTMVDLNRELCPDVVLFPSSDDTHQDHVIVSSEARRAFKRSRLLGYEAPWNNYQFENSVFVPVTGTDAHNKIAALKQFGSQSDRDYMSEEYVVAQLRFRGVQAGVPLAEAFQMLRWYL